jgi:hypothetical protein
LGYGGQEGGFVCSLSVPIKFSNCSFSIPNNNFYPILFGYVSTSMYINCKGGVTTGKHNMAPSEKKYRN